MKVVTAGRKLRAHQRKEMLEYCLDANNPALFVEMRLGKTLVAIRRCRAYPPGPRLVVAPNSALGGWRKDLSMEMLPFFDASSGVQYRGTLLEGLRDDSTLFVLTNRESHISIGKVLRDIKWQAIIIDESTFIKNPRAKVTRFYVDEFHDVPHRWILAGRPAPEGAHEYFEQLRFIGVKPLEVAWSPGKKGFYEFRAKHMTQLPHGGWMVRSASKRRLEKQVAEVALVLRREDVGLPDTKIYEKREVYLSKANYAIYDSAERNFILECPEGPQMDTKWAVVRYQWLRQLAGGFIAKKLVDSTKIDELLNLLKNELSGDRIVVMCYYDAEVNTIKEVLAQKFPRRFVERITGEDKPDKRNERINAWAASGGAVLICQQAVAQMGMDLSASDTMIYYSRPPGALANAQSEDRILSVEKSASGTPLLYIDLVSRDTIDEDVIAAISTKESAQDRSLSYIRKIRASIVERRKRL